ncbi:MAG: hypothetical protein WBJ30_07155 [Tepidanaerobacteraceae bacterium]
MFLSSGQAEQGQRAGSTLAGTRQDAELPANPCGVKTRALVQQVLIIGMVPSYLRL